MTRTLPNRLAPHATPIPPIAYGDAIAGAVAFLHAQLRNPDIAVGMTAAIALLDLEKTRMRHGQPVAGTDFHIAAGLPAGVIPTEAHHATDSPSIVPGATSPAGKPAAIWQDPTAGSSTGESPTETMTVDQMLADPEMLEVIRQARREMERADPSAQLMDESVGQMVHDHMQALRRRRATPSTRPNPVQHKEGERVRSL